ncbi:hypothetical protein ACFIOY_20920 [Bradyrhizobium sp. TZ2]
MTSYDDWYPSNYFKADDVIDNPMVLTITAIRPEKMQDGKSKPCVFFKEDKRALVLNVSNKNFLILLTRSKDPADAVDQRVMLVAVEAEYQGKPCMALRLRRPPTLGAPETALQSQPPPAPKTAKRKPPTPDDDKSSEAA